MQSFTRMALVILVGTGCGGEVATDAGDTDEVQECTHPEAARGPTGGYPTNVALEPNSADCPPMVCEVWAGHGLHLSCTGAAEGTKGTECDFLGNCVCEGTRDEGGSFSADFGTMQATHVHASGTCDYTITPLP